MANSEKINIRWRNKAFAELSTDDQRKIKSTTIHAIIFEQKKPENDDTSLYQVFERINTSGRTLTPQEIRNCVYQGPFNTLLFELNENNEWRKLFGIDTPDSRMRDVEFILRFFVMKTEDILHSDIKQISLKKSLNDFMNSHKNDDSSTILQFKTDFEQTVHAVYVHLGERAFRNYGSNRFAKKFHPAIFDAVMVAAFLRLKSGGEIPNVTEEVHKELLMNDEFKKAISKQTTNIANIRKRICLAEQILFGADSQ